MQSKAKIAAPLGELERALVVLTGLLLFTLNELRLYRDRPHAADLAHGFTHLTSLRVLGGAQLYLSGPDVWVRACLAGLAAAAATWAVAGTLRLSRTAKSR